MATCDVTTTLNFSKIFMAKIYVSSFEFNNILAKNFIPYVLIFGILFNLMFLFVVARLERMRTVPNFYLSVQALADCLYLITQTGPAFWRVVNLHRAGHEYRGNWYNLASFKDTFFRSAFGCFIQNFTPDFCYHISIGVVIAVSFDRYLAIVHPLRYQRIKNCRRHTIKVFTWIFITAFVLSLSRGGLHSAYKSRCIVWPKSPEFDSYQRVRHYCDTVDKIISPTFNQISLSIVFTVAMLSTTYFYSAIVYTLGSRRVTSSNTRMTRIRNQIARMVVITGIVFFMCQLPFRIYSIIQMIIRYTNFRLPVRILIIFALTGYLTHVNCALNALLYLLINPLYRKAWWDAVSFWKKPSPHKIPKEETGSKTNVTAVEESANI